MFATNRRLKVSLLVVGVLMVVFGMYGAFQVQEATAHHPKDGYSIHRDSNGSRKVWTISLGSYVYSTTCDVCGGRASQTTYYWRSKFNDYTQTFHRTAVSSLSLCHWHDKFSIRDYTSKGAKYCHNSSCGG